MIYQLAVPGPIEDVEEVRVLEWHGAAGSAFAIGELIVEVLDALSAKGAEADEAAEAAVRHKVKVLLARFPIYPD